MDKEGSVAHFLKYNNTVPIVLGMLFLSTTATMAASPAVRDSVYSSESTIQSADNSYLLATNLEKYDFAVKITKIEEDAEYYYLSYELETIDVVDGVWQDIVRENILRVSKALLGKGDLEDYARSELAQVRASELYNLQLAQKNEEKIGKANKVVTTTYKGIVGKFMEPTEEVALQYQSEIAKNDPLRLKNPKASLTWDANAVQEMPDEEEEENPWDRDECPNVDGIQLDPSDCPADSGGGTEEPPVEEPPVEEPPAEEPPAEEPPVEEAPAEESPDPAPAEPDPSSDAPAEGGGE